MVTIFRSIGWNAHQLEGGYKAWRREVVAELDVLPRRFRYRVLCGATGSARAASCRQSVRSANRSSISALACRLGTGRLPDARSRAEVFRNHLLTTLREPRSGAPGATPRAGKPESDRLQLRNALIESIRAGDCVGDRTSTGRRVDFLLRDYDHFLRDLAWPNTRPHFKALRGKTGLLAGSMPVGGEQHTWSRSSMTAIYDPFLPAPAGTHHAGSAFCTIAAAQPPRSSGITATDRAVIVDHAENDAFAIFLVASNPGYIAKTMINRRDRNPARAPRSTALRAPFAPAHASDLLYCFAALTRRSPFWSSTATPAEAFVRLPDTGDDPHPAPAPRQPAGALGARRSRRSRALQQSADARGREPTPASGQARLV